MYIATRWGGIFGEGPAISSLTVPLRSDIHFLSYSAMPMEKQCYWKRIFHFKLRVS